MSNKLKRLLHPASIAVFGGNWSQAVIEQCRQAGFDGELWPVHPEKKSLAGLDCYASVAELPGVPDASFIAVNRHATIAIVAELSARDAGGVVCFASGFSEAEDEDSGASRLQAELLHAAGDMPVLGPNCYGFINHLDGVALWPDQHGGQRETRGVAILSQSSNIAINLTMQRRGLPIAFVVTAGNQAQQSLASMAEAMLDDDRVTAIGLYIESFADVRAFEQLAVRAHAQGVPLVALKSGATEASRQALLSHTRSFTGSDAAGTAFLERLGIVRVTSLSVMLETLKLMHAGNQLSGRRVLSMSCSGGEAALMADAAAVQKLVCPALTDEQHASLRSVLGARVALANPLDYHTYIWDQPQAMQAMVSAMATGDADVLALIFDLPRGDRCNDASWRRMLDVYMQASVTFQGLRVVLATLPENLPEPVACELLQAGIVPLHGLHDGLAAIAAVCAAAEVRPGTPAVPVWLPEQLDSRSPLHLSDAVAGVMNSVENTAGQGVKSASSRSTSGSDKASPDYTSRTDNTSPDSTSGSDKATPEHTSRTDKTSTLHTARQASALAWGMNRPVRLVVDASGEVPQARSSRLLDECTAKRWLNRFGVHTPTGVRLSFADVRSSRRVSRALDKVTPVVSYPVVVKSLGMAHKTGANGIELNITGRRALEQSLSRIDVAGGCLVENQISGNIAELLVSVVPDPVHGLMLTVAAGGVATEVLDDAAHALLPVTRRDINRLIDTLRCVPLLNGHRGAQSIDRDALIDAIEATQAAALQLGERLVELEINPLLCTANDCLAVDALVLVRDLPGTGNDAMETTSP